uniref:Ras-related protein Rab-12 n=1 Tax=Papio anubis TaxID=9555 RepID=A0A8I5NNJ7_PAPAN
MDPGAALQRRVGGGGGGGGLGAGSPALSGGQGRRRKQHPRPADFKLQVIIIGSRGVGKTSLMERFTDDTFCEACKSTVGVDFKIKTVELRGKKIRLQIWDTAGQERFNSITSAYYRSAKGIILVYDITKKETFDDLPKWMKMIDKYASEDAELLLVGNKLDCETDREISRQQGEKFAQQITGMRFCEASAKDNFNVDEIFLKLVDDILKKNIVFRNQSTVVVLRRKNQVWLLTRPRAPGLLYRQPLPTRGFCCAWSWYMAYSLRCKIWQGRLKPGVAMCCVYLTFAFFPPVFL